MSRAAAALIGVAMLAIVRAQQRHVQPVRAVHCYHY
jgi:hypothetical protein